MKGDRLGKNCFYSDIHRRFFGSTCIILKMSTLRSSKFKGPSQCNTVTQNSVLSANPNLGAFSAKPCPSLKGHFDSNCWPDLIL